MNPKNSKDFTNIPLYEDGVNCEEKGISMSTSVKEGGVAVPSRRKWVIEFVTAVIVMVAVVGVSVLIFSMTKMGSPGKIASSKNTPQGTPPCDETEECYKASSKNAPQGIPPCDETEECYKASSKNAPQGIPPCDETEECYNEYSLDSVSFSGIHIEGGRHYQNTFGVIAKHTVLPNDRGVHFNVETLPEALPDHRNKPKISRREELETMRESFVANYNDEYGNVFDPSDVRIEATSEHEPDLFYRGGNGFIVTLVTAFAQHLPLELSPDHVWSIITYAFAKHVDENAEELRKNFVSHEGKKRIEIETPNSFQISYAGNPDSGATAAEWETSVFSQFSAKIKSYIGEETHSALTADFSTTDASSQAASEIVLMAAMKNYFSFSMDTLCGIPEITLRGSEEDWAALRQRAEALGELMLPSYKDHWMPALLPVLDKFVESYRGQVDHGFWQSMVKLRHNGEVSGYREFISGWVQIFFPYLSHYGSDAPPMRQWNEMYFSGPDTKDFLPVSSFVPCDWNYFGTKYDLEFHAGITGARQDPETGCVAPVTGWHVIHELPKPT